MSTRNQGYNQRRACFRWQNGRSTKAVGLLKDTQPDGHMVAGTVQGQCQDPITAVGVPSSLESGSLMQGPPESQSVGLAYLQRVKRPACTSRQTAATSWFVKPSLLFFHILLVVGGVLIAEQFSCK